MLKKALLHSRKQSTMARKQPGNGLAVAGDYYHETLLGQGLINIRQVIVQ